MDISGNYSINDMMYYYQRNIRDYSDNIHEFNTNMTYYLSLLANEMRPPQYINREPRTTPNLHTVFRNLLQRRDEGNTFLQLGIRPMEDVIVRPTAIQFERATQSILYDNTLVEATCPITLETFQENDEICRIRHCGHTFKRQAIQSWFQRNVRCPVCRYDIREYVPPPIDVEEQDEGEFDDLVQELSREYTRPFAGSNTRSEYGSNQNIFNSGRIQSNNVTNTFTNAIRSFVNRELQNIPVTSATTELLYTFDIPIGFDASGNYQV
jgi:hypothetical protein